MSYKVDIKKLKSLRIERGLTQEQVGQHIGLTKQGVGALERGIAIHRLPRLVKLAELYGLKVHDILIAA
jgi:DNA-binding XRE family transcriptional regulator